MYLRNARTSLLRYYRVICKKTAVITPISYLSQQRIIEPSRLETFKIIKSNHHPGLLSPSERSVPRARRTSLCLCASLSRHPRSAVQDERSASGPSGKAGRRAVRQLPSTPPTPFHSHPSQHSMTASQSRATNLMDLQRRSKITLETQVEVQVWAWNQNGEMGDINHLSLCWPALPHACFQHHWACTRTELEEFQIQMNPIQN